MVPTLLIRVTSGIFQMRAELWLGGLDHRKFGRAVITHRCSFDARL